MYVSIYMYVCMYVYTGLWSLLFKSNKVKSKSTLYKSNRVKVKSTNHKIKVKVKSIQLRKFFLTTK